MSIQQKKDGHKIKFNIVSKQLNFIIYFTEALKEVCGLYTLLNGIIYINKLNICMYVCIYN